MTRIERLDAHDGEAIEAAARLLVDGFREHWPSAWPTIESARFELTEALSPERLALVARTASGEVAGWVGGIPMYDGRVWEMHPLVVGDAHRGQGVARALVEALEDEARARGGLTLWLGTDDEDAMTSLGGAELFPDLLGRLAAIQDLKRHPFGLYLRLGFSLAGVVPDANGFGKPDILMAKSLR